ncbi:MAG TPA: AAA family ATPase [Lacunisphaera sp.]|nr:AAA family ATPase [Lacunisphaera sp.]
MKLTAFRVQKYKGVIDSGPIAVEPLTVVVGKNESGKTTLLKALHKLNPATPEPYNIEREWPRGRRRERSKDQIACAAVFTLERPEVEALAKLTNQQGSVTEVTVTRDYEGRVEVAFADGVFPDRLHPNDVDRQCEVLPEIPSGVGSEFRERAERQVEEVRRLALEGRFAQLAELPEQHAASLQGAISADGQTTRQAETDFHAAYVQALKQVGQKLTKLPTMQRQAHDFVVSRLPKFIYMADYRTFQGRAILNQVKERRDSKKLQPDDETFLMLLKLSGLDLDDLVARGSQDDREQRQYDLDDAGKTLTGIFKARLRQREYQVEYRADGQEFYTMVKDQTDAGLIRLDERSKGFQWFFSFDMLFMHESDGTFEHCVLLLDEPGLHLHPEAQRDLLARLDEYAKGNTLIYSTHLPFMLDLRHPERIRVINETDQGAVVTEDLTETHPEAKLTLQAALGMSGSQSYLVAQRNVVVEGADDHMLLTALSELLVRSGEEGLAEDVLVTAAGGASEAAYIATFMIGQRLGVVVLLDSDAAGNTARDKLVKSWLTRYKGTSAHVLDLGRTVGVTDRDFSIEDLFPDDFYLLRVKEVFGKELASAGISTLKVAPGGQLCKRVERALKEAGISFNKGSVAKRIRRDIATMKTVDELPESTRGYTRRLMAALNKAFQVA